MTTTNANPDQKDPVTPILLWIILILVALDAIVQIKGCN